MRDPRLTTAILAVLTLAGLCLARPAPVHAAPAREQAEPFELSDHNPEGMELGRHLDVLIDETGAADVAQLASAASSRAWRRSQHDAPSFGFTSDALWLRLRVVNRGAQARPWLMELAYPNIDRVTLFVPGPDGSYAARAAGDMLPFPARDLPYRNVVFSLEEPAGELRTYYLRLQTSGSLVVPLRAWSRNGFFSGQANESAVIWMFYGLTLVMGCYNLFLFLFIRLREYLLYTIYVCAMGAMNFTLYGHTYQYVLHDSPELASAVMPASVALLLGSVVLFADACLNLPEVLPRVSRILRRVYVPSAGALVIGSFFLPYSTALRFSVLLGFSLIVCGPVLVYMVARSGSRPAQIFLAAYACLILGTACHYLQLLGWVSSTFLTRWGIQIGASAEMVLLSVALAERINSLRADLTRVNGKLTERVEDLKLALSRAEQATRAKGEFLATMSHELRTPLNAIINIPQAIAERFRRVNAARCASCRATFTLDPGETLEHAALCPECRQGTLRSVELVEFRGDGLKTLDHLAMVERAGEHLLQMVNGVLDFSRMEAGRVELRLDRIVVPALLRDAVDTVAPLAARAQIELQVVPSDPAIALCADPLRVKQVLINLLGNAIKFSPAHAKVEISAERQDDHCLFSVRDHGIGIAPQDLSRVFHTFEQVDQGDTRRYGGTGLGLSISRTLVELHGGEIWVHSELGKGSTFFVRLPLKVPMAKLRSMIESESDARSGVHERAAS